MLRDILAKVIDLATTKFGAEYVETRAQHLTKTMLTLKEGRVEAAKQGTENGVALRILVKGAWGFASVGSFEAETLSSTLSDACRMAQVASKQLVKPIKLANAPEVEDKVVLKPKKDPVHVPFQDKIKTMSYLNDIIMHFDKRIKSCTIDYLDLVGTCFFMNNSGSYIEQDKVHVWSRIGVSAVQAGAFSFSREEIGSTSGYEVFEVETPQKVGERAAKSAVEQLKAEPLKGGTFPVVLGPSMVGVFAHEAFGHLAEADLTLSGSVLSNKLNKKIASDLITIYDDGTIEGAFGSFKYDDEGVASQKTMLVDKGVVAGLMHNRETAQIFGAKPTGNSRAEDFRVDPMIRMRNTYIQPKDYSLEELFENVKFGYYLKTVRGGQANLDGTFQAGVQEAYEIVNGEIGNPVRNASISGNTLETLFKIDAVGKDFELWPGRCGKGQEAFICSGGPHLRVKEVLVGGSA